MTASHPTPGIENSEPDFRNGRNAASANGLSGATANFKLRHYLFWSSLFTPGGIA
jgi:hypothetical protein